MEVDRFKKRCESQEDLDEIVRCAGIQEKCFLADISDMIHIHDDWDIVMRGATYIAATLYKFIPGIPVFRNDSIYAGDGWVAIISFEAEYALIISNFTVDEGRVRALKSIGISTPLSALVAIQ